MPHCDVSDARRVALSGLWLQDGLLRVVAGSRRPAAAGLSVDRWLQALVERHTSPFTRPEFLKAVRALSSRYVEARSALPARSPLDTAGKRAAFAGFYAPLHYLTVAAILRSLAPAAPARLVDLGCGTGAAGAAWAVQDGRDTPLIGVDQSSWALEEFRWNCRSLGLAGRSRRGSLTAYVERDLAADSRSRLAGTAIICAWSLNELAPADRDRTLPALLAAHGRGASVLVVEPIAASAVPWWDAWRVRVDAAGGRADEWRFEPALPPLLAELDEAAGFRREALTARSFWLSAVDVEDQGR